LRGSVHLEVNFFLFPSCYIPIQAQSSPYMLAHKLVEATTFPLDQKMRSKWKGNHSS